MKDRSIDVSSSRNSTVRLTRLYPGPVVFAPETTVAERHSRKRVPTGGPPSSFLDEKPFLHTSRKDLYPSGRVLLQGTDGSWYRYEGQGAFNIRAGSRNPFHLTVDLSFPPGDAVKTHTPSTGTGLNPDLLSQAEVKCLNKLRDKTGQSDLDFGLWYGERRETASMFREGAVGILNLARSIAQKDYRKSAQVLRDVFGVSATAKAERQRVRRLERWLRKEVRNGKKVANRTLKSLEDATLTYNLGVSPLLKDLQEVHLRLLTGDLVTGTVVKSVAKHSRVIQDSRSERSRIDLSPCSNTVTLAETHGYTVTLVARPRLDELARLSRFGLTNPINTMYQLTGLTFLLDYFVNLGPYLESLNTPMQFEFVQGSYTQRIIRIITQMVESAEGKMTPGVSNLNHTQRKLYTKFPVPIPPLSGRGRDLSVKQSVNAGLIALKQLRSLLGK